MALDLALGLWHKRGVPMTLFESQCYHGPGIGIHGLVFGKAIAPVGFCARVVPSTAFSVDVSPTTAHQRRNRASARKSHVGANGCPLAPTKLFPRHTSSKNAPSECFPGLRGDIPALSRIVPEFRNEFPGFRDVIPGLSGHVPGLSGGIPEASGRFPGPRDAIPEASDGIPGPRNLIPARRICIPARPFSVPKPSESTT